jgi:putative transposase
MKRYHEASNFVAERAFVLKLRNKYKLHRAVYREIRECFGLSSQLAIRIISKIVDCYKPNKIPWFKPFGAIQYDQRNSRISIDNVSIMTLQGRVKHATRVGHFQRQR